MSRRPRFPFTGYPLHVVQRGNDRQPCFFVEADYLFYLDSLGDPAQRYSVEVHAYVLMTKHIHLLVTPLAAGAVIKLPDVLFPGFRITDNMLVIFRIKAIRPWNSSSLGRRVR